MDNSIQMRIDVINQHNWCDTSNFYSSVVVDYLILNSHIITDKNPNMFLFMSCSASDTMIDSCIDRIAAYVDNKKLPVVVFGCTHPMKKYITDKLITLGFSNVFAIGYNDIDQLDMLFHKTTRFEYVSNRKVKFESTNTFTGTNNFVLISDGCVNKCSYCRVKAARGNLTLISRPIDDILNDIGLFVTARKFTVSLLADDCGAYGFDIGNNIVDLLKAIHQKYPTVKVRLTTFFPTYLIKCENELMDLLKTGMIDFIFTAPQCGSQRVLELMNRHYSLDEMVRVLTNMKPYTKLAAHFVYGFPTETFTEFKLSVEIAKLFDHSGFTGYTESIGIDSLSIVPKCTTEEISQRTQYLIEARDAGTCLMIIESFLPSEDGFKTAIRECKYVG